jgi:hypothetical protein
MNQAKCPICQQRMTPIQRRLHQTCGEVKCRLAYQKSEHERRWRKQDERHQQRLAAKNEGAKSFRDQVAVANEIESPDSYHVIVAPANRRRLAPLNRRRRYQFAKKLIKIIRSVFMEQSVADLAPSRADDEAALPVLASVCATCQGKCCNRGGTHAFLCEDVIRRFRSNHPEATARQIILEYLRRLPSITSQGSCVFHGIAGCSLPKTMRSATCNTMVCGAVAEVRARSEVDGSKNYFIAATEGTNIVRSRFIGVQ